MGWKPFESWGRSYRIILADKTFTCADGSGSFKVHLVARLDNTTLNTTASWRITAGTSAYVHLHGHGSLTGTPVVPNENVYHVYDGSLHWTVFRHFGRIQTAPESAFRGGSCLTEKVIP